MPQPRPRRAPVPIGRAIVASFAALAVLLAVAGWAIEQRMRAELRARALDQLSALADLKVDRISAWRAERLADAAANAAPPVGDAGLTLLARGEPSAAVAAWYRQIRERHLYADVLVVSAGGEPLFSAAGQRAPLDAATADAASRALASGRAVLSDLYRNGRDGRTYLDAAAPIPAPGGGAAFVLRSDAETLYPLLREWPGSARTAEALLVRREGDEVLFLSDLRHERDAAFTKRIPLARAEVVAVQAATGAAGVREGVDYRGVPVLAETRAVPDSTWWLVAKVDRDEIFATERQLAWAAWASLSAFLALVGLLAATWVRAERHRRAALERATLDDALRYRAEVLANVDEGVISTDADARIISWNRGAERIYGWTESEALGRTVPELLRSEYGTGQPRAWMLGELERNGRVELTLRQRRKDGAPVDIDGTIVARRDAQGAFLGYIGVNRDVTERRRAEAELKRASERLALADRMASMGTLAAGVAHEVNNPLAYVLSNLAAARETAAALPGAPGELVETLREANEGAERVRRIVAELRTLSRPDDPGRGPVDVRAVLDAAVNLARHEIRHRARVVKRYEDVPPVDASESRLAQAFLNLVVNAAQAIPEGHAEENEIRISARAANGRVRVEIADTGVGIAPEHLGRIFDPFFTTKPVGVGTGLGLAIAHGIVSSLGGEIHVASTPGRGSTFTVAVPAAAGRPAQAPAEPPCAPAPGRRGRVLVVDDEPPLAQSLRRTLGRDHDVVAVSSGRAALDLIQRGDRFDVILCDLMMPEITGMDLAERLDREAPDAARRLVFMTGGAFTPRAREFLDDPARRHIEKPFDLAAMRALVRELVGA
ncbi:MAG TPA: ATP-binding protein [Anaeromyxobacter sp.]|nr:ATP-binding protein [Anaeromyxobacter sp.]